MNKKPAKYLDSILEVLSENFDDNFTVNILMNRIEYKKYFGEKDNIINFPIQLIELRKALTFLDSKKLIHYNSENEGEIRISYEGYLRIRTNSFTNEIMEKSINKTLQRISWIIPIVISIAALIVSIFKDCHN